MPESSKNVPELHAQDVCSILWGWSWRVTAIVLAVPLVFYHFGEFGLASNLLLILSLFLIGQGCFVFGKGSWLRSARILNSGAFLCEFLAFSLFATNLYLLGGDYTICLLLLLLGMVLRLFFYGRLLRKMRTRTLFCWTYGVALLFLYSAFFIWYANFNPAGTPHWIVIPKRIFAGSAIVIAFSILSLAVQLRLGLEKSQVALEFPVRNRLKSGILMFLIILFLAGATWKYGDFCLQARDARNEAFLQQIKMK
ncbi:MAG: hypothetical protein Q4D98_06925 [Planctomycetia bacterium]|nr:hypothetical protein [Planctomycetia bacterium]